MVSCPFQEPITCLTPFGDQLIESSRFEQREGLSVSKFQFEGLQSGEAINWPFKSFSQIVFVLRGNVRLSLPDVGWKSAGANEWFALSLNGWESICEFNGNVELIVIECSQSIWRGLATDLDAMLHTKKACFGCHQRMEAVFLKGNLNHRLWELTKGIANLEGANATERLLIDAKTLELMALVTDSNLFGSQPKPEPCERDETDDALAQAAAYLEQNLAAEHSLATISRQAKLNEFKLKKGFKERFNTTVFGYLRQKRMERARELLSESECTVLEAANAVGYANPSHFTRAFRESFGINPKDFLSLQ